MSVFNGMQELNLQIKAALVFTILFAGSWCLSQTSGNLFWFCISRGTYVKHILIWISMCWLIFITLYLIGKRKPHIESKIVFFLFILSLMNIMDYAIRSVFGVVSKWPIAVLAGWSVMTVLLPTAAACWSIRFRISRSTLQKAINVCILPCVLLVYYALPSDFTTTKIEKPLRSGQRPPVHFILFDMLSYNFMFKDDEIDPNYRNFKSLSASADVYLKAYSSHSTTGQAIPRLLTGVDFERVGHVGNIWTVQTQKSSKMENISSYRSIFSLSHDVGYNVFLRAFALPYLNNFQNHIQSGEIYPFDTLWRSAMHSLIWPVLYPGGVDHQKTTISILDDYLKRIIENPDNTFFYLHWNIPHDPFIYDADGQMTGRLELTKELISRPDRGIKYNHQLAGTDRMLGQIIQTIKDSGTYEKSLIIITSDHNIKGFGFDMKRIPLIIKWPYQKKANRVFSKVTSLDIFMMLQLFIQSQKYGEPQLSFKNANYQKN